jgi:hypothetical protein
MQDAMRQPDPNDGISLHDRHLFALSRRRFLRAAAGAALGAGLPAWLGGCASVPENAAPAWKALAASLRG